MQGVTRVTLQLHCTDKNPDWPNYKCFYGSKSDDDPW